MYSSNTSSRSILSRAVYSGSPAGQGVVRQNRNQLQVDTGGRGVDLVHGSALWLATGEEQGSKGGVWQLHSQTKVDE